MEGNFSENMNLGNNIGGNVGDQYAVTPISTTTTGTTEIQSITRESTNIGTVQNMHLETEFVKDIICDEAIVRVAVLKSLVSNAKKVAEPNQYNTLTQVVLIELGNFGIKVNSSNGKVEFESIDSSVKYTKSLRACVDIQELSDLVNNLDFETVTLDVVDSILEIKTPEGGSYKFSEKTDLSTQQSIEINLTFDMNYEDMHEVDLDAFVNNIKQSKPIRDIPKLDEEYAGTFFSDIVMSSNRAIIYVQDNQPILKSQRFFVTSDFCKLITDMNFDKTKFRMGFTTDSNNDIVALTMSDGKITMCGPVEPTCSINEEVCKKFWNAEYPNNIVISTKKLTNALKRIDIMSKTDKADNTDFEFNGLNLRMTPLNSRVVENITLESNDSMAKGLVTLPRSIFSSILNSIKEDKIIISFDNDEINFIGINTGEYRWIIGAIADED